MAGYTVRTTVAFARWLGSIRQPAHRDRLLQRIERLEDGILGDTKPVGSGIYELRLHFGPGFRIYYAWRGDEVVLLLQGGDKGSQRRDIARARQLNEETA